MSTFLYANEVVTEEWDDSSTTYSMPGVFLITYDRFDLSLNDQQKYKMLKDLEEKICSNSNTKALLHKGITVLYNFVYKEGTLLVKIDRCN